MAVEPRKLIKRAPVTSAWLALSRRRWRRKPPIDLWENRRRMVAQLAPGKSFLDMGGMYGIHGDVAFLAEEAGATEVLLCDGMDPVDEFQVKHRERDSQVRYAQCDVHDAEGTEQLGQFDVVWCVGVIYHSPNPFLLLQNLRQITRETLVLGSHVIPEVPGMEQSCIWYPGRSEAAQRAFARVHGKWAPTLWGISAPFDYTPLMGYSNCFWGFTHSALRAMLEVANFEVVEEHATMLFTDLVAKPKQREPLIPPADLLRRLGEQRVASFGDELPPWAWTPAQNGEHSAVRS